MNYLFQNRKNDCRGPAMRLKSGKFPLLGILSILLISSFSIAENQKKIRSYCGSNSVYALLKLNKINVKLKDITELPIVKKKTEELSLLDLKNIVNNYGLDLECVKIGIDQLELLQKPFIAHFFSKKTGGHFFVGWFTDQGVHIIDYPEAVLVEWEFLEEVFIPYTGHALVDRKSKRSNVRNKRKRINIKNTNQKQPISDVKSYEGPRFNWLCDNTLDCGLIGKDKVVEEYYIFKFSNIGNKTLVITDLKSSCSCLEAKAEKQRLKPGEESYIRLKIDRDKIGSFEDYCYFKTNDVNMKLGKASIKGTIYSPVQIGVVPNKCDFGNVIPQKKYSKKIKILNTVDIGHTAVNIKSISNTLQNLISTKLDDEWKEKKHNQINLREISLTIDLYPDVPPGNYKGEVIVIFNKEPLLIPVSFSVKPFVEAYPSVCVFNLPEDNTYKKIAIKTDRETCFTIESIRENTSWIKVRAAETTSDVSNYRELILEIDKREDKISRGAVELAGKIDSQNWTVNIPVIVIKK